MMKKSIRHRRVRFDLPAGFQVSVHAKSLVLLLIALSLLGFPLAGSAAAAPGDIEWIRQFSGIETYEFITQASGAAYAGQVYVVGLTYAAPGGPTGPVFATGGFVRLYDTGGNEGWTRHISGQPYGVAADASGVYVGGMTWDILSGEPQAFVSKYDTNGNEAWTREFGSSSMATNIWDWVSGIAVDASGVYVVGGTEDALPGQISAGSVDAFVRKYDANGSEIWTRQFGTSSGESANGVATDDSGVYVVGTTQGAFPGQTSAGGYDAFARKYDADGGEVWTRQFGSASGDDARGIVANASGVYAAGYTEGVLPGQTSAGYRDGFVRRYDADGGEVWTRQFGTSSSDSVDGIAVDAAGVYVAGVTGGAFPGQTNAGSADVFVRKYDAASDEVWTRQFGTSSVDGSNGVAADASGVYVFGDTRGTFPGQTSSGRSDAFVAKIQTSQPPAVDAGGPYDVDEGGSVTVTASGTDPEGGPLTYAWDLDNDGTFETPGQSVTFAAEVLDGPSTHTIGVEVIDNGGLTATDQASVNVLNVAPTADFTGAPSTLLAGESATLAFGNPFDPGAADMAAGFRYSYDCTNDGTFELEGASDAAHTCAYPTAGTFAARGRIADKDGGFTDYTVQIIVLTPQEGIEGIIDLVGSFGLPQGIENSLIVKLQHAVDVINAGELSDGCDPLAAFIHEVNAQAGKKLTQDQANQLIAAANQIRAALGCQ